MDYETGRNSHELTSLPVLSAPAIELLTNPVSARTEWPAQIANNRDFEVQLEARQELIKSLEAVISRLPRPDVSLQEAVTQEQISESQVAELYSALTHLLEDSPEYRRMVLYLPFELLPDEKWQPRSEELQDSAEKFKTAYLTAWNSLLTVQDVRANFVDGDVLEAELRNDDLPRVVKAAHLIPKLIEKGLMVTEDALKMLESSNDQTLKHSIADTLPVLADLGFIREAELTRMKASDDLLLRNMAMIIEADNSTPNEETTHGTEIDIATLQHQLLEEFSQIENTDYGNITKRRSDWLQQEKKNQTISAAGDEIRGAIVGKTLTSEMVSQIAESESDTLSQRAMIDGICKAIEESADANSSEAAALYQHYRDTLELLWPKATPEIHEALTKTFCRLRGLNIITGEQIKSLGITIPALAGPFSENLKVMKEEMREVQDLVKLIELDPKLSEYIYPLVLMFGSRLKGYSGDSSDIDLGVFVRPDTSIDNKETIQTMLKKYIASEKIQGELLQFWLDENAEGLAVHDYAEPDVSQGSSYDTHILFGSAWEGDKNAIRELREKLLTPYIYETDKLIHGREARGVYLEELERDTLQYRLMHKGYERFYPAYGGIHTAHADQIDGQSMFWDSGYRQMATKLFANRVFLPKISKT